MLTSVECDRSFTRSDALAKHMRTVHETEALRPSDPVPKRHDLQSTTGTPVGTPGTKLQRIKLKLSHPPRDDSEQYSESANDETTGPNTGPNTTANTAPEDLDEFEVPEFSPDTGFDDHELNMSPHQLYRLLRRQIHWAEKEGVDLRGDWEKITPKRMQAWSEKEAVFDDMVEAEVRLLAMLNSSESRSALVPGAGASASASANGVSASERMGYPTAAAGNGNGNGQPYQGPVPS